MLKACFSIPATFNRVEKHTNEKVKKMIEESTKARLHELNRSKEQMGQRLKQLDREWDTERVLEANAASFMLLSIVLGLFVNKKWFLLGGTVAAFLFQHAIQGWCPPLPVIRRLGIRTAKEIYHEKNALRLLQGKFKATNDVSKAYQIMEEE